MGDVILTLLIILAAIDIIYLVARMVFAHDLLDPVEKWLHEPADLSMPSVGSYIYTAEQSQRKIDRRAL